MKWNGFTVIFILKVKRLFAMYHFIDTKKYRQSRENSSNYKASSFDLTGLQNPCSEQVLKALLDIRRHAE